MNSLLAIGSISYQLCFMWYASETTCAGSCWCQRHWLFKKHTQQGMRKAWMKKPWKSLIIR